MKLGPTVDQAVFYGRDAYAQMALRRGHVAGSSYADADLFVATRGLTETVIPDIDESVFALVGDDPEQVARIRESLRNPASDLNLWSQPTFPMELQMYLRELVEDGEVFVRVVFDRVNDASPYFLADTTWLAPETMVVRQTRHGTRYEQFVSHRAYNDPSYIVEGSPHDHTWQFAEGEILHLCWPLDEPVRHGAPSQAALRLGIEEARYAQETLLNARAGAEPAETYLPVARARAGAFANALDKQKVTSAKIKDMLFYPGAYEAEIFPWVEDVTDYFRADRILRSRIAICRLREYLLEELNTQLLGRWTQINGWREVRLTFRPQLFTLADWTGMHADLNQGNIDLHDVRAAVALEYESGHQYGRYSQAARRIETSARQDDEPQQPEEGDPGA